MNSQCFVSLRRNSTNGLSFPMNINGIHDNDLFKDHEYIKGLIENISNVAELKEFIILTLGKGDGKFVDFFFKTLSSFEVLEKLIIQYSFENDGRIEKGDIEYDFKTKEYTLTVRYEVEEDQDEEEPVFGEMGLDDWPDSWFDVEFENKCAAKENSPREGMDLLKLVKLYAVFRIYENKRVGQHVDAEGIVVWHRRLIA